MAWGARLGLKAIYVVALLDIVQGLNGLGSPFGIESRYSLKAVDRTLAG